MYKSNKTQEGFTIMEAVVSAALFAFFVTSVIGIYLSVLRLDSRTRAQRAVADNSRFIMEFLAKEVRNGHIDYPSFPSGGPKSNCRSVKCVDLYLVNQDNESEHILPASASDLDTPQGTDLVITKGSATSNLNSSNVKVTKLKFEVSPIHDPFASSSKASNYNEQPHVTVILELTALSTRDPVKINIQSTLSEDYYPAR